MAQTKVILACDFSSLGFGLKVIDETSHYIDMAKIGLEAMTAEDGEGKTLAFGFRHHARKRYGIGTMWDMKIHDVKNTMKNAAANIIKMKVGLFTLHATASNEALAAVAEAAAGSLTTPLAVTVLTDLDDEQCQSRFVRTATFAVRDFATNAYNLGIRGFVCSPLETKIIRDLSFGDNVTIVTPGIRPACEVSQDEQKRITTPSLAALAGADYVVIGRPIYNSSAGKTPEVAARDIKEEIQAA